MNIRTVVMNYLLYHVSSAIAVLFICLVIIDYYVKKRFAKKLQNRECIPHLPLIGSIHTILYKGTRNFLEELFHAETSKLVWIFFKPIFVPTRPEEIQSILMSKKSMNKSFVYEYIDFLKGSILFLDLNKGWGKHRKNFNRCLTDKKIYEAIPEFYEFSNKFGGTISNKLTMEQFNIMAVQNFFNNFFATIGNLGIKNASSLLKIDISTAIAETEHGIINRYLNPWLYSDTLFYRTEDGKKYKRLTDRLDESFRDIVNKKAEIAEQIKLEGKEEEYGFMDTVMDEYSTLDQIKSELKTFGIAATETISMTLSITLLLLGMHLDIQQKLYEEVISVVGVKDPIEVHHLSQLKYTFMVISEALRLFPPVLFVMRRADEDINLGDAILPKNSDVFINIASLHRNEKIWKDPLKYIPERFSPEEVQKRHPCSYLPFSYGPRNCIGKKYAEVVLKINLANIIRNFKVYSECKSVEDIEYKVTVMGQIRSQRKIKFEKRNV